MDLINVVLNPVMLFILMYSVGGKISLNTNYLGVIVSLFLGVLVVDFAAGITLYYTFPIAPKNMAVPLAILVQSAELAVSVIFTGFTAAALGFFRKTPSPTREALPPSQE